MHENMRGTGLYAHNHDAVMSDQEESMKSSGCASIGDLEAAVFDEAAYYSADLRRVSHLAMQALKRLLWRARRRSSAIGAATYEQRAGRCV